MVKTNKNRRAFGRLLACERDRNARCTRRNGIRKTTHEPDNWTTLECIIVYRLCASDNTYRSEGTKRFLTHDVS